MRLKEKLAQILRNLSKSKVRASALKITIKTGEDAEEYTDMTIEELEEMLEDLEQQRFVLQDNEPEDEESDEYEEWEDAISEIEDLIDEVRYEIEGREE